MSVWCLTKFLLCNVTISFIYCFVGDGDCNILQQQSPDCPGI
uniref:Uncharacterized protein n=1 Tax=Arundo donax TaxID=35708 RepID=A0A0A8ZA67_ARUDO